jgi:hypothetical protein
VKIDRFIDGSKELMEHCGREGVPHSKPFTAAAQTLVPGQAVSRGGSPDAAQVKAALASTDKRALQTLLDVRCAPEHADVVDEMRKAWRGQGTPGSTLLSDCVVQAVIARCLIQTDSAVPAEKAEMAEATSFLRSAIHSDDVMAVVAAVQGLAIVNAGQDVPSIAEVPHRMPGMLNAVVRILGFTCGDNNLKTIAAIRQKATTQKLRDQIDAVYGSVEPVRKEKCEDSR